MSIVPSSVILLQLTKTLPFEADQAAAGRTIVDESKHPDYLLHCLLVAPAEWLTPSESVHAGADVGAPLAEVRLKARPLLRQQLVGTGEAEDEGWW